MSDLPHGRVGHSGYNCEQCGELKSEYLVIDDPELGRVEMLHSENSLIATNGHFGGWVEEKDGGIVSIEYAKTLNRAQRRARGIKLVS